MSSIDARYVSHAVHDLDGTVTEGRKGLAYLRDHYVPALAAELVARVPAGADAR